MSCINCDDCKKVTSKIPECGPTLNDITIGDVTSSTAVIVRVTKLSSGAITEYAMTSGGFGDVTFQLSNFDQGESFFRASAGFYKFEVVNATDGDLETMTDAVGGVITGTCLLIEFTPLANVGGPMILAWIA